MTAEEQSVINAALALCETIAPFRESLTHPKHAQHLDPLRTTAKRIWAEYFTYQGRDVVKHLSPKIHAITTLREDAGDITADERRRRLALSLIPDSFQPLSFALTAAEKNDWADVINTAIDRAAKQLADEIDSAEVIGATFQAQYLREHSMERLAKDIQPETVKQLRAAVVDAYTENAEYGTIVNAIQDAYAKMSSNRAELIAQTELNTAYNAARGELAARSGMNEKAWATESGDPCPICLDNEAAGWIPIEDAFPSGDQLPTAHPRCYCSADFRTVS